MSTRVEVTLNAQQIELLRNLCAEHGFDAPEDALRHGLREYLATTGTDGGAE